MIVNRVKCYTFERARFIGDTSLYRPLIIINYCYYRLAEKMAMRYVYDRER